MIAARLLLARVVRVCVLVVGRNEAAVRVVVPKRVVFVCAVVCPRHVPPAPWVVRVLNEPLAAVAVLFVIGIQDVRRADCSSHG